MKYHFRKNDLARVFFVASALLATALNVPVYAQDANPEAASGKQANKVSVHTQKFMVATANPLATNAAYEILKKGGSAVDAAIAAQLVLGLTEPQSSGIAGGAFLLTFDGKNVTNYDGRETAPKAVNEKLFQTESGADMSFYDAVVGGRSVGVPGVLAMLDVAHKREGKLPWAELFQPAISLAENGFAISPRLHAVLVSEKYLYKAEAAKAYFYQADGITPKAMGTILKNPEYAGVLKTIAQQGAQAFYTGDIAKAIVNKINSHPSNPSSMTLADMADYKPKIRTAVCGHYHDHKICGPAAPASGIVVLQILGMLEHFDLKSLKSNSAQAIHYYVEAGSFAFADRNLYIADPDFVKVPTEGLLNKDYLASRSALINPEKSIAGKASAGVPEEMKKVARLDFGSPELTSTSHISIVDANGHAVSMTTSIENQFGSRQFVKGILLNNQLTDFSFSPVNKEGAAVANRVQGGKRPRSSMSPMLVFDKTGNLEMIVGSPGGPRIINYVAQTLINLIDWKMDPQIAVDTAHYGSRNDGKTELEKGFDWTAVTSELKAKGHNIVENDTTSGLSVIIKTADGYIGGADSRREGIIKGD